jgi:superfamily II DNA or RNA helicase
MKAKSRRDEVLEAIAAEEARLVRLTSERAATEARIKTLRDRLDSAAPEPQIQFTIPLVTEMRIPHTAAEKVALFRSLFRGRQDIFPTRFVSKKSGKSGYAPACHNKFVRGVCDLPKVRCGECSNQAFIPADDAAVLAHLQGRHVMGVYPLLEDETCWFLALDFDKSTWVDDVTAFAETCRLVGIPAAVERSRSGNGAHVWFFFSTPVVAADARKLGCYLLTETMARRHQLSMESYDRLFPSQDTMPRGGFGNLIALPLQREARQQGNSIFLDEQLTPYPDEQQWAYLASVPRIDATTVGLIAREASRLGSVVGICLAEEDADASPWTRPPSRRARNIVTGPFPATVKAVLAQKLFVEKSHLSSSLINQIKRLAAFQNPEFYKKQSMRLSTALTPRVIACAEDLPQHIGLPRGCRDDLQGLLGEYGIDLEVDDQRVAGNRLSIEFRAELTAAQERAARTILAHDIGLLVAPPGAGKTVVGTYLVAKRSCSTLILVHRRPLLDQWTAQLALFLGIEPKEIGQIGAGKRKGNGRIDVGMIQSLMRKGSVDDVVAEYGQIIVDECHHLPAVSFERVLSEVRARYVVGLTATPQRRDGHQAITHMQLGPIRFAVNSKDQAAQRPFAHRLVVRETSFKSRDDDGALPIQRLYAALANDERRNQQILEDVCCALREGRSPILLTERKEHLQYFVRCLSDVGTHVVVLGGGMSAKEQRTAKEQLVAIPKNEKRLLLATGRYIGEGFDDARLDTLFLALPVSWKGTLIQYAGRLHRLRPDKTEVRIFDYVDREVPVLSRMFEKRMRGYQAIGYVRQDVVR